MTRAAIQGDTLPEAVQNLRKRFGSHDLLAAELGTTRQTVIRWEKGANPKAYRDALIKLGVPHGLFPTPQTRRDLEQRVARLETEAERTAGLIVRLTDRLAALEAAPVRRARRVQQ